MPTIVSYSEFRDNLSRYFSVLKKKGTEVVVKDARNGKELIRLKALKKKKKEFDWDEHEKWMASFKPFWTDEDAKHLKKAKVASRTRREKLNW